MLKVKVTTGLRLQCLSDHLQCVSGQDRLWLLVQEKAFFKFDYLISWPSCSKSQSDNRVKLSVCLICRCVSGQDRLWQQGALLRHFLQRGLLWDLPSGASTPGLRTVQGHSPWPSTLHCVLSHASWPWGEGRTLSSAATAGGIVNVCFTPGGIKGSSGMITMQDFKQIKSSMSVYYYQCKCFWCCFDVLFTVFRCYMFVFN